MRAAGVDVVVIQPGTFPDGNAPALVAERVGAPVVVHSLPEPHFDGTVPLNSLCGANLITFTLTELRIPHTHVHGDAGEQLLAHVGAARALAALRRTTLRIVGSRVPGFFPCIYDEIAARRTLGVAAEYVGLQELEAHLAQAAPGEPAAARTIDGGDLDPAAAAANERWYAGVRSLLEEHGADVVAIRDWPELYVDGEPGGIWPGLGRLQDEGRVIAVEGDANAALTMAVERQLQPDAPWLTDIVAADADRSTLTLWHYAGPPSLARDRADVRYTADGKEVEFTLRPGKATLARIGLHRGQLRLLTIVGEVLDEVVHLTRAGAVFRTAATPADEVVRVLLDDGWEHHTCLAYGDLSEQFAALARYTGIEHTRL
jgi:L-fucose isomerase-like protein